LVFSPGKAHGTIRSDRHFFAALAVCLLIFETSASGVITTKPILMSDKTSNSKISRLFELDSVGKAKAWPNYLQYGFTAEDVPDLLTLVAGRAVDGESPGPNGGEAAAHAWRALGQLGGTAAIEPLIDLFGLLCDDDLALMEVPVVLGMLGEPGIEPLLAAFRDTQLREYARCMAGESLKEIVLHHPEQREAVVTLLTDYLRDPDTAAVVVNASTVAILMDLKATESIDTVRALYDKGCVEVGFCGDIEDVEIGFGLREQRETPRPDYWETRKVKDYGSGDEDDGRIIGHFLQRYGHEDSIRDISELDGFFTAIGCAPELIKTNRWLPAIWGGKIPQWRDPEESQTFTTAVTVAYNDTVTHLSQPPFKAMFNQYKEEGMTHPVVEQWCAGFLRGYTLWQPLEGLDKMAMEEQMEPISLFATEEGVKHQEGLNTDEITKWRQRIEPAADRIYQMFTEQREAVAQPVERIAPKVGRNEPCPCGSGKKYKKCCMQ